jgi:prepilin-type N-terminal cleavage/methylation domain-containing protein
MSNVIRIKKYKMRKFGFTLLELLSVLGIVSLLSMLVISPITNFYRQHVVRSAAQKLNISFQIAYIRALQYHTRMMILPIQNNWQKGWQVFEDVNKNTQLDANELIIDEVRLGHVHMSKNKDNLSCIIFNSVGLTNRCINGQAQSSGLLSNGTISFAYSNANADSTTQNKKCQNVYNVILSRNRARICEATKNKNNVCECI